MTDTQENLKTAFAGESQANRRNPETLIKTTAPRRQLQRFVRFCYYVPQL